MILLPNLFLYFRSAQHYKTPYDSFKNSASSSAQLLKIIEQNDISMVVYAKGDSIFSHIIVKDNKGWQSLHKKHHTKSKILLENGKGYLKQITVSEKNVFTICLVSEQEMQIENSTKIDWKQNIVQTGKEKIACALGVSSTKELPQKIKINEKEYVLEKAEDTSLF